jgi:two-component system LytT family sensor kinase
MIIADIGKVKTKFYRHLLFWLACSVQGTLLEYTWIQYVFARHTQGYIILLAISFNMVLLPAKILFTYYALEVGVNQPFRKPYKMPVIIAKLTVAMLLAIILYRVASVYIIDHMEYPRAKYTISNVFDLGWDFVALLDIGYVAGIAAALKLFRMQMLNLRNEKALVKDKLETELKFLKNQINPHFLFNTLNNIYALARKKSDKTPEVVVRLSKLLRFMLYESAKDTIPIEEEIRILEDYVQLEEIRHTKKLDIIFEKEIDNYNQRIAPLILLPFIENAFKHGINETIRETAIVIKIKLIDGRLSFYVMNSHDNEPGAPVNENIGLKNVRRQLELMYNDFTLNACNLERNFIVDLDINLNSDGKI